MYSECGRVQDDTVDVRPSRSHVRSSVAELVFLLPSLMSVVFGVCIGRWHGVCAGRRDLWKTKTQNTLDFRFSFRLEIRGTARSQRRLIDLKPGEIRSVKLEIIYNRDRSQVIDSDQK